MDHHPLIPPDWAPDDALRVCELLEALHTAIWRAHGHAMNLHLDGLAAPDDVHVEDDDSPLF